MTRVKWSELSLLVWVTLGMALTVLPLALSAIVDHILLDKVVIASFDDVAARYRDQIAPVRQLQLELWEAAGSVDEYLDAREPAQAAAYRDVRVRIETGFTALAKTFASDASLQGLVRRAEDDWSEADHVAADLLTHSYLPGDEHGVDLDDRFSGVIASSVDKLHAVDQALAGDLQADHVAALRSYERSQWISGIAAGLSVLAMILGISVIARIMLANIARLVHGARQFAEGDRDHRIEVHVPPELREVADEFNRMIGRIHETESALAEQARRDAMTGLCNRRAFEEALSEAFARMRRLDERVVLLTLDVDHFKKVNDTYGHAAGDDVLRAIGKTLTAGVREIDKAFRTGGEEFSVLLSGTDVGAAVVAAERLRAAIAATPVATGGSELTVTASFGLAISASSSQPDELLKAADTALYAAKSQGRNRVVVANDDTRAAKPIASARG